ncbi:hypothetical protein MHYP_G00269120 [Metynnis hypsauchen]
MRRAKKQKIGSPREVVMTDECKFGHKHKYNQGRSSYQKSWVFGMLGVQAHERRPVLCIVKRRSTRHLMPILKNYLGEHSSELKCHAKQTKQDIWSQLRSLSEDTAQIKETIQQPVSVPQQSFVLSSQKPQAFTTQQSSKSLPQSYQQSPEWGVAGYEQLCGPSIIQNDQQQGSCIEQRQQLWKQNQSVDDHVSQPSAFQPQPAPTPYQYPVQFQHYSSTQPTPNHSSFQYYSNLLQPYFHSIQHHLSTLHGVTLVNF